jgi:hypothetical protein
LQCELITEVGNRERFADLAKGWVAGVREEVFPDLDRALAAGPVLYRRNPLEASVDIPWGEPGAVWAQLHINKGPEPIGGRRVLYTVRAWQRFLDGLAEYPFTASIDIKPLDSRGQPAPSRNVFIEVRRVPEAPDWVRFGYSAGDQVLHPGTAARWLVFGKKWAETLQASSGTIGASTGDYTALEYAIGAWPGETIPQAREVLRGYSWVTLLAGELARRLGGPEALAATGAFYEVAELKHGAVWLQATREPAGYEGEAVRRVFEALAPVLLTGLARKPPQASPPPLVYEVDAANYR